MKDEFLLNALLSRVRMDLLSCKIVSPLLPGVSDMFVAITSNHNRHSNVRCEAERMEIASDVQMTTATMPGIIFKPKMTIPWFY